MKEKIVVYTNSTCGYCKQMKETLNEANIKFTEKPRNDHQEEWGLVQMITGLAMFPTIKVEGKYLVPGRDFHKPEHALELLKNIDKFNSLQTDDKLLEAFKTLTYSFNNGFQRLFNQLTELQTKLNKENEHESTD